MFLIYGHMAQEMPKPDQPIWMKKTYLCLPFTSRTRTVTLKEAQRNLYVTNDYECYAKVSAELRRQGTLLRAP
jgi:hypothetical protein